jgi:hypothetical protein
MNDDQKSGLTNTSAKAKPADAKQQAQFDLLLGRARQMMEQSSEEWLSTLKASPVDGAVTLGTETIREISKMSEKAGQPVDPVVLVHVGTQFCKDIAAVANKAGLVKNEELPQFLKDVMSQSMMAFMQADKDEGLMEPQGQPEPEAPGMLAQMQQGGAQ